jgi:hypothetical protein
MANCSPLNRRILRRLRRFPILALADYVTSLADLRQCPRVSFESESSLVNN